MEASELRKKAHRRVDGYTKKHGDLERFKVSEPTKNCPHCKGSDMETFWGWAGIYQDRRCKTCGFEWTDYYK